MDRRVDVFAMGIVLWELLVGRPLFRGENDAIIISQITSGKYMRPIEVLPQVPKRLDAIVMQALRPAPVERFATAAAFADALDAYAPELGGLASAEDVGRLVMLTCGERVQKRRHHVHEVIGGRRPPVAWGASPPRHGSGSGSAGFLSQPSGSLSTHHAPVGPDDPLEPLPNFRSRPSMGRLAIWIGGGMAAAVVVVGILAWAIPSPEAAPAAPPPASSTGSVPATPQQVDVRIEADREIVELRVPEGDNVEIAGHTATFTAARGEQAVTLTVKFDDGSELSETVVPTANAVIKVRSASASVPSAKPEVVPKATGANPPPPPGGKGPRFQDNPYE